MVERCWSSWTEGTAITVSTNAVFAGCRDTVIPALGRLASLHYHGMVIFLLSQINVNTGVRRNENEVCELRHLPKSDLSLGLQTRPCS